MDTSALKKFATRTRKDLIGQVARRLAAVLPADSDARREAPAAMAERVNDFETVAFGL
jgi:hypothetical protein